MKASINAPKAPVAIGPYAHAAKVGNLTFLSGQLGLDPESGALAEGIEAQTKQALENVKTILAECGLTMADVVKTTIYLDDMAAFPTVNEIYAQYFTEPYPARSCVAVQSLPKNGLVEIEVIAAK